MPIKNTKLENGIIDNGECISIKHVCKQCGRTTMFSGKHYEDGTFKCAVCLGWWGE